MSMMGWLARQDGYDPNAFDVPGEQTYDRRLDQTWPGQLAQDAIGAVLAPGRALQSTEPITTEQMIKPAFDLAGLITGGSYAAPAQRGASGAGIRAYHSSPHDFDKFDLAKIGSGEGAQVYGHGLYFAESPAVSGQGGQYWQQFKPRFEGTPEAYAANVLESAKFDRGRAVSDLDRLLKTYGDNAPANVREARALLESGQPVGPRTYEVNINADPAHMLDWDKPLSQQSERVRAAIPDIVKSEEMYRARYPHSPMADPFGSNIYSKVGATGGLRIPEAKAQASEFLREAGIPGIKYLDQGSRITSPVAERILDKAGSRAEALKVAEERLRTAGMGDLAYWDSMVKQFQPETSNFVIFDPNLIRIDKKYAVPGAIGAGGMGAFAAQDEYRQ